MPCIKQTLHQIAVGVIIIVVSGIILVFTTIYIQNLMREDVDAAQPAIASETVNIPSPAPVA